MSGDDVVVMSTNEATMSTRDTIKRNSNAATHEEVSMQFDTCSYIDSDTIDNRDVTEMTGNVEEVTEMTRERLEVTEMTAEGVGVTDMTGEGIEVTETTGEGVEVTDMTGEGIEVTETTGERVEVTETTREGVGVTEVTGEGVEVAELTGKGLEGTEMTREGVEVTGEKVEVKDMTGEGVEVTEATDNGLEVTEMTDKGVDLTEISDKNVDNLCTNKSLSPVFKKRKIDYGTDTKNPDNLPKLHYFKLPPTPPVRGHSTQTRPLGKKKPKIDTKTMKSGWLTDNDIHSASQLLKKQFPHIDGFQNPVLGTKGQFDVAKSQFVQILHNGTNHWLTVSNIFGQPDVVDIYDSMLYTISLQTKLQIATILFSNNHKITYGMQPFQRQKGGDDCGLFAIAAATAICFGISPSRCLFHQEVI